MTSYHSLDWSGTSGVHPAALTWAPCPVDAVARMAWLTVRDASMPVAAAVVVHVMIVWSVRAERSVARSPVDGARRIRRALA